MQAFIQQNGFPTNRSGQQEQQCNEVLTTLLLHNIFFIAIRNSQLIFVSLGKYNSVELCQYQLFEM